MKERRYNVAVRIANAEWEERRDKWPRTHHSMAVIARKHGLRTEQLENYRRNYFCRGTKNRNNMKHLITTLIATLTLLALQQAQATLIDPGPRGTYFNRSYDMPFTASLTGQDASIDINFSDSITVLYGGLSGYFDFHLSFATNAKNTVVGFTHGTGYLTDQNGAQISPAMTLGSGAYYNEDTAGMDIALFPFDFLLLKSPVTFYGAHFDLMFPDSPYSITDGSISLLSPTNDRYAHGFRVGPFVPETGNTLLMLLFGVAALQTYKNKRRKETSNEKQNQAID